MSKTKKPRTAFRENVLTLMAQRLAEMERKVLANLHPQVSVRDMAAAITPPHLLEFALDANNLFRLERWGHPNFAIHIPGVSLEVTFTCGAKEAPLIPKKIELQDVKLVDDVVAALVPVREDFAIARHTLFALNDACSTPEQFLFFLPAAKALIADDWLSAQERKSVQAHNPSIAPKHIPAVHKVIREDLQVATKVIAQAALFEGAPPLPVTIIPVKFDTPIRFGRNIQTADSTIIPVIHVPSREEFVPDE